MTEYEMQQMQIGSLKENMTFEEVYNQVYNFINNVESFYYLLLEPKFRYITVFHYIADLDKEQMANEIADILMYLGKVKLLDYNVTEKYLNCWVVCDDKVCRMFKLFDYMQGVVEV